MIIALGLLGIIASFTFPKVLEASAKNKAKARLIQAVATLESAWSYVKSSGESSFVGDRTLYDNLLPSLNVTNSINSWTNVPDGPFSALDRTLSGEDESGNPMTYVENKHPCTAPGGWKGWVQFKDGTVIAGLTNNIGSMSLEEARSLYQIFPDVTYLNTIICIDTNGAGFPNKEGVDVYYGMFNLWGAYAPGIEPSLSGKNFNWGNSSQGLPAWGGQFAGPGASTSRKEAYAGIRLN